MPQSLVLPVVFTLSDQLVERAELFVEAEPLYREKRVDDIRESREIYLLTRIACSAV